MIGSLKRADETGALISFTWEEVAEIRDALAYSGSNLLSRVDTDRARELDNLIKMFAGKDRWASL